MYNGLTHLVRRWYASPPLTAHEPEGAPPSPGNDGPSGDGAAKSAFFQHLPLDIRRLILVQAFGDRALHVEYLDQKQLDILYQQAGNSWGALLLSPFYHNNSSSSWGGGTKSPGWYGFICDEASVAATQARSSSRRRRRRIRGRPSPGPWKSAGKHTCLQKYQRLKGSARERADIGAVGWLRASKRAFIEGAEVLYTTNRFHIITPTTATPTLVQVSATTSLLLPPSQHLAFITSLQIVWTLGRVARPPAALVLSTSSDPRFSGWRTFTSLLSGLPRTFPRLRKLCLSLRGEWFPLQMAPNDVLRRFETDLLAPVDEMVETMLLAGSDEQGCLHEALSSSHEIVVAIPIPFCFSGSMSTVSPAPEDDGDGDGDGDDDDDDDDDDPVAAASRRYKVDEDSDEEHGCFAEYIWRSLLPPEATTLAGRARGNGGQGKGYWVTHIPDAQDSGLSWAMPELLHVISQRSSAA